MAEALYALRKESRTYGVWLRVRASVAAVSWIAFLSFIVYGFVDRLVNGPPLELPGRYCEPEERDADSIRHGPCYPSPGWHIEPWLNTSGEISDAYVHNGADINQWRVDVATSFLWNFLTRQQQRDILDGKATIKKFRTAEEIDRVTINPTTKRPTYHDLKEAEHDDSH